MASIRDVAKLAGFSPATVSRILNQDTTLSVKQSTKDKVRLSANQLGYIAKEAGRSQTYERSKLTIAVLDTVSEAQELDDPYFADIRRGIEEQAQHDLFKLSRVIYSGEITQDLPSFKSFGGVLVIGTFSADLLKRIQTENINMVVISDVPTDRQIDTIRPDFDIQTDEVLDHLHKLGHSKIAFIGGSVDAVNADGQVLYKNDDLRLLAYKNWMQRHHLEDDMQILLTGWNTMKAYLAVSQLLKTFPLPDLPTAFVAASDPIAVGTYRAILNAGYKIPKDFSVTSFDDIEAAQYLVPALSSVHPASKEIGREAVRLIRQRIFEQRTAALQVIVPSEFIERESIDGARLTNV
ncbi:MAG: LacI family DNA-binding transcriptional regulator [Oenococcus sp.]|uniref:LacI family DNA-binding transcriptional regulator n=1 Tax=Oenococcus sp. TaxID=1979414 RepID=UPI0039EB14F1